MAARTGSTPRPVLLGDEVAAVRAELPPAAGERRAAHAALPGVALAAVGAVEPRERWDDEEGGWRREAAHGAHVEKPTTGPGEPPLGALLVEALATRTDEDLAAEAACPVGAARDAEEEAEDAVLGRAIPREARTPPVGRRRRPRVARSGDPRPRGHHAWAPATARRHGCSTSGFGNRRTHPRPWSIAIASRVTAAMRAPAPTKQTSPYSPPTGNASDPRFR